MESIRLSATLPATPEEVYAAWLSSDEHTKMTGSAATVDAKKSGRFTAWDGYITGTQVALDPGRRIVQAWRTTEFPGSNPDSKLEIRLTRAPRGCRLVLLQSGIPDGQGEMYTEGWEQHYFEPMNAYFASRPRKKKNPASEKPSAKKAASRKSSKAKPSLKKNPAKKKTAKKKTATKKKKAKRR